MSEKLKKGQTAPLETDIRKISINLIDGFPNHPFYVFDDDEMSDLTESIRRNGLISPVIVRKKADRFELISGHRRKHACELLGHDEIACRIVEASDDEAIIMMVDSNCQRTKVLPSERAFAYKMKLEALKKQGARSDLTSRQIVGKLETADLVGKGSGESGRQVQRFIRLTNLIPELLNMVDEKKLAFNPAVELSYLDEAQQRDFLEAMNDTQNAPSLSQAQRLKKLALEGHFSYDAAFAVMGEAKKDELDKVVIKNDTLRKYFPRSYTPKQMEDTIIKLLEQWQRKRQRQNER